jgi:predicted CoA-binding protein
MTVTSLETVNEFLSSKRIALVGLSRNSQDFSRAIFREFLNRGYDVVPVNPNTTAIESRHSFPSVKDISPPVEAALIMTPATAAPGAVLDCAAAGVKRIWLHRGAGQGAMNPEAVRLCGENGIHVVAGECPFMHLPDTAWFHRAHRLIRRITGKFPK